MNDSSMEYRHLIEEHLHEVLHDQSDEWVNLPVRAVILNGGPAIEIGPWSLSPGEASVLSRSLLILAELADPRYRTERVNDPIDIADRMRAYREGQL